MAYFGGWPDAVTLLMRREGIASRAELARRSNLPASTVSDYLNGNREPGIDNFEAMLQGLGADFADLHRALLEVSGVVPIDRLHKSRRAAVDALKQLTQDIEDLEP